MQGKCECSRNVTTLNNAGQSGDAAKTVGCNQNKVFKEHFQHAVNEVEEVLRRSEGSGHLPMSGMRRAALGPDSGPQRRHFPPRMPQTSTFYSCITCKRSTKAFIERTKCAGVNYNIYSNCGGL